MKEKSRTVPTVTLPTVILVAAITGALGYAIGTTTASPVATAATVVQSTQEAHSASLPGDDLGEGLPPGHPAVSGAAPMPMGPVSEGTLVWTPPARWQTMPNTSSMRLATYKIPHAPGDTEDAEMSVTQVGGSVDANIDRWIGQFGATGEKNVKRTHRVVGGLTVSIVEIQGTYSGGMDPSGTKAGWALLGAIVETADMPHFFKMTGPAKTVAAARPELDAMLGTLKN